MKKILIIFFTFLFSLTSFSVFAKEYAMKCEIKTQQKIETYKLVDKPNDKNLYVRKNGEWVKLCIGNKYFSYRHKGDSGVCIVDALKTSLKSKSTEIFDFFIYTYTYKLDEMVSDKKGKSKLSNVRLDTFECEKIK